MYGSLTNPGLLTKLSKQQSIRNRQDKTVCVSVIILLHVHEVGCVSTLVLGSRPSVLMQVLHHSWCTVHTMHVVTSRPQGLVYLVMRQ